MYQPTLARFQSRDPLSQSGIDLLTDIGFHSSRLAAMRANPWFFGGNREHPYGYARNSPINWVDPSGEQGTFVGGGVTATTAGIQATIANLQVALAALGWWNIAAAIAITAAIACLLNGLRKCIPGYERCSSRAYIDAGRASQGWCAKKGTSWSGGPHDLREVREINQAKCISRLYGYKQPPCRDALVACMLRCGLAGYSEPAFGRYPPNLCDDLCVPWFPRNGQAKACLRERQLEPSLQNVG